LMAAIFFAGFAAAVCCADIRTGIAFLALSLVFGGYCLFHGLKRVERFFIGARGEEKVCGILKNLPEKYHVFNDFIAGRMHVDHVVVGPAGVFAVETKFWRGRVTIEEGHILVDGRLPSRAPLAQVQKEAARVKAALFKKGWDGPVIPVLVFASDTFAAHIAEVDGAVILNARELMDSFSVDRVVIPDADLERLVTLMENNV